MENYINVDNWFGYGSNTWRDRDGVFDAYSSFCIVWLIVVMFVKCKTSSSYVCEVYD